MHKERAIRFWVKDMDFAPETALSMWMSLEKATPELTPDGEVNPSRDENGPAHSKLRLPICTEEFSQH